MVEGAGARSGKGERPGGSLTREYRVREDLGPFILGPQDLLALERLIRKGLSHKASFYVEAEDRSGRVEAQSVADLLSGDPSLRPAALRFWAHEPRDELCRTARRSVGATLDTVGPFRGAWLTVTAEDSTWALGRAAEVRAFFKERRRWYWLFQGWQARTAAISATGFSFGWLASRIAGEANPVQLVARLSLALFGWALLLAIIIVATRPPTRLMLTEAHKVRDPAKWQLVLGAVGLLVTVVLWVLGRVWGS